MQLDFFKLDINGKELKVAVADTATLRYKGLSDMPRLGKNKGMLFIFEEPKQVTMVMRDMNFDLDFILLDSNWEVVQVESRVKDSEKPVVSVVPIQMVIEVNKGYSEENNITPGLTLKPEKKLSTQLKGVQKFKHWGS